MREKSQTQHDRSSQVDHDLIRPLQDEAFMDDFFMDLFSGDQLSKERFEEDNVDDELDQRPLPWWESNCAYLEYNFIHFGTTLDEPFDQEYEDDVKDQNIVIDEFSFSLVDEDTVETE